MEELLKEEEVRVLSEATGPVVVLEVMELEGGEK